MRKLLLLFSLWSFFTCLSFAQNEVSSLKIVPNPVGDSFSLPENNVVEQMTIFNILGRPIRTFRYTAGMKYSIADLPDGIYLLRLQAVNNSVLKTLRFSHVRIRA